MGSAEGSSEKNIQAVVGQDSDGGSVDTRAEWVEKMWCSLYALDGDLKFGMIMEHKYLMFYLYGLTMVGGAKERKVAGIE